MKNTQTPHRIIVVFLLSFFAVAVFAGDTKPLALKQGVWRGVFTVNESKVPFNFEIKGQDLQSSVLTLLNGSRRRCLVAAPTLCASGARLPAVQITPVQTVQSPTSIILFLLLHDVR